MSRHDPNLTCKYKLSPLYGWYKGFFLKKNKKQKEKKEKKKKKKNQRIFRAIATIIFASITWQT